MNTKHTFKSKKESFSLDFQDSNLKVNRNNNSGITAHLMDSCKTNHKEVCEEKTDSSKKETGLSCQLPKSKDTAHGRSVRTIISPIVETNLKDEDVDFLSTEMGDEIAKIVVDEIVSQQSLRYGAITRKPADNFI